MLAVVLRWLQEHLCDVLEENIVLDLLLSPVEENDDFLSETLFVLGLEITF